jgi:hypothetical protein
VFTDPEYADFTWTYFRKSDKSYKKECQEKNLPHWLDAEPLLSGRSAPLIERALLLREWFFLRSCVPLRLRVLSGDTLPLPCGSISLWCRRPSFSETTSLTVVHWRVCARQNTIRLKMGLVMKLRTALTVLPGRNG